MNRKIRIFIAGPNTKKLLKEYYKAYNKIT